jgi:hypothetical protein
MKTIAADTTGHVETVDDKRSTLVLVALQAASIDDADISAYLAWQQKGTTGTESFEVLS